MTARLRTNTERAAAYLKEHGSGSIQDIARAIGWRKSANALNLMLIQYIEHYPNLYQVRTCGRQFGMWAYRERVIPERMQRSIMDIPPLDTRCLGRPIIVVR